MLFRNFFTSGWQFADKEIELKNKFQMMNIALVLSSLGLIYGVSINFYGGEIFLSYLELFLVTINIILFYLLRYKQNFFSFISLVATTQFTFLFLYLIYTEPPEALKHSWIFTYPIVILYFQKQKSAILWLGFMIFMLLISPFQSFVETKYSFYQVSYLTFVLMIISIIIYFYQKKMDDDRALILSQQNLLQKQIEELMQKDKILTIQSKQAVMGEMISMIAHQWRQPLSTVTLSVSNIQVKKLLGEEIDDKELEKTLEDISNTVVYLSQTIDDFQTYFHPNRELTNIKIDELLSKVINFVKPRLKDTSIFIEKKIEKNISINVYQNELIQVLLNIINNGIDELISREIKNPSLVINVKNNGDSLTIDIEDNAGGIEEKYIDSIFEPYFSTKGKNGTGLGLYMSQMIMQKQFNSQIVLKRLKNGSSFSLIVYKKLA